jgi:phosphoenolpyruvate-protein kinase (PTS system EI component)
LDAGGDNYISYFNIPFDDNPFFGQRGVRVFKEQPDILKTQLRAILRASSGHHIAEKVRCYITNMLYMYSCATKLPNNDLKAIVN